MFETFPFKMADFAVIAPTAEVVTVPSTDVIPVPVRLLVIVGSELPILIIADFTPELMGVKVTT